MVLAGDLVPAGTALVTPELEEARKRSYIDSSHVKVCQKTNI